MLGTTGNIGGSLSHEYHFKADIGEDKVLSCKICNYSANLELCKTHNCPECGEEKSVDISNCIEVYIKETVTLMYLQFLILGRTHFLVG